MNRRAAALLIAGLAASGCKSTDDRRDRARSDPPARPAGRSWLDGPGPKLADVRVPPADTWADAREPGYDLARDVRGVLTGQVLDPDGKPARGVFVEVEPADAPGGGAPMGVETAADGYFLIKGLKPDQAYQLTVSAPFDGRTAAGRVYVRTGTPGAQRVRLPLVPGLHLPTATPVGGTPAPDDRPPRTPAPPTDPRPDPTPADPPAASSDPPPATAVPPSRPELSTQGLPGLARPPVMNVAPPGVAPPAREARSAPADKQFQLLTPAGDPRDFPGPGLVLLAFGATADLATRRAEPLLTDLCGRYGLTGLEVVGVACDAVDLPARQAVAGRHQRAAGLNYLLYVEPVDRPGPLAKRFGVAGLPGLVLLDAAGAVRWKGKPDDAAGLERAIREHLPAGR